MLSFTLTNNRNNTLLLLLLLWLLLCCHFGFRSRYLLQWGKRMNPLFFVFSLHTNTQLYNSIKNERKLNQRKLYFLFFCFYFLGYSDTICQSIVKAKMDLPKIQCVYQKRKHIQLTRFASTQKVAYSLHSYHSSMSETDMEKRKMCAKQNSIDSCHFSTIQQHVPGVVFAVNVML